ncbi:MAG TPA: lipopolysaccharide heptosyltransferase I [Tepidisphaeraceae bacterium]|nr:lipopolysaccharide heptosyltransferase I [Tepidisphaeraceae bacterium]
MKPSSLGDIVHALPVFALLRRRFPEAHIAWLVAPYCAGLLKGLPGLDQIVLFDRRRLGTAWRSPRALMELLRFHRDLRQQQFDLVIDLQGLFRSGWLAWQTRAAVRIGFANARELAWVFYTHRVPIDTMEQHAVERYLKIAAALGCETQPVEFRFPVSASDRDAVSALLPAHQRIAVLMPGTNWITKRWPAEHFAALVQPLKDRFGLTSVVAGGKDAAVIAPQISGALDLTNKTSIPQLISLLERADLVIANDSGPMHIAAALNRPLVTLFGPTNPVRTGPYARPDCVVRANTDCAPCYRKQCPHQRCLRQLDVETVLAAIQRQLAPVR